MIAVDEACEFHPHKFVKVEVVNSVALVVYLPDNFAIASRFATV